MSDNLKPGVRRATYDAATLRESAARFRRVQNILKLTHADIASRIGCSKEAWGTWVRGEARAPDTARIAVDALLEEANLTSQGKIRVA
jgi:hypothetical protein